LKGLILAQN